MSRDYEKDLDICENATPGPWEVMATTADFTKEGLVCEHLEITLDTYEMCIPELRANVDFIVLSREALPYYIRRCMELEAQDCIMDVALSFCGSPDIDKCLKELEQQKHPDELLKKLGRERIKVAELRKALAKMQAVVDIAKKFTLNCKAIRRTCSIECGEDECIMNELYSAIGI